MHRVQVKLATKLLKSLGPKLIRLLVSPMGFLDFLSYSTLACKLHCCNIIPVFLEHWLTQVNSRMIVEFGWSLVIEFEASAYPIWWAFKINVSRASHNWVWVWVGFDLLGACYPYKLLTCRGRDQGWIICGVNGNMMCLSYRSKIIKKVQNGLHGGIPITYLWSYMLVLKFDIVTNLGCISCLSIIMSYYVSNFIYVLFQILFIYFSKGRWTHHRSSRTIWSVYILVLLNTTAITLYLRFAMHLIQPITINMFSIKSWLDTLRLMGKYVIGFSSIV